MLYWPPAGLDIRAANPTPVIQRLLHDVFAIAPVEASKDHFLSFACRKSRSCTVLPRLHLQKKEYSYCGDGMGRSFSRVHIGTEYRFARLKELESPLLASREGDEMVTVVFQRCPASIWPNAAVDPSMCFPPIGVPLVQSRNGGGGPVGRIKRSKQRPARSVDHLQLSQTTLVSHLEERPKRAHHDLPTEGRVVAPSASNTVVGAHDDATDDRDIPTSDGESGVTSAVQEAAKHHDKSHTVMFIVTRWCLLLCVSTSMIVTLEDPWKPTIRSASSKHCPLQENIQKRR